MNDMATAPQADDYEQKQNDHLVLISGESASGKSMSLKNIRNPQRWIYMNCEAGKKLPFKSQFQEITITDPYQVFDIFEKCEPGQEYHEYCDGIIIDTLTFLMDMFESIYIVGAANGQAAWGAYNQYFKRLMQYYVARSDKAVIVLAHARRELDETDGIYKVSVPIKGALKGNGIESYFSTVVSAKRLPVRKLKDVENDMFQLSPRDERIGVKHVFQTDVTKETVGERIRAPFDLFSEEQLYIDNDAQKLLDHLIAYYG